jgi:hypothetical protein
MKPVLSKLREMKRSIRKRFGIWEKIGENRREIAFEWGEYRGKWLVCQGSPSAGTSGIGRHWGADIGPFRGLQSIQWLRSTINSLAGIFYTHLLERAFGGEEYRGIRDVVD